MMVKMNLEVMVQDDVVTRGKALKQFYVCDNVLNQN
jgi:hypothetical protein